MRGDILFRTAGRMESFEREVVSDLDDKTDDRRRAEQRLPLHVRILLGLAMGGALGGASRGLSETSPIRQGSCFCARY
jgi:hypothetical protein